MIELFKLERLPQTQKIRKIIKILEQLETHCVEKAGTGSNDFPCNSFYIEGLLKLIEAEYPSDLSITGTIAHFSFRQQSDYRTVFNTLRHILYRKTGFVPSEWDLIVPGTHYTPQSSSGSRISDGTIPRPFFSGLYVYAEDIRAPFNLGSIFRTAEAFGIEKIFLSESCVSPAHSRAKRSAMGCVDYLPWEWCTLENLPANMPVFALETGGTPIENFDFPKNGIVLIGSEELGLSKEALEKASADAGIVSISMKGIKASLNVSVACGILLQWWTRLRV